MTQTIEIDTHLEAPTHVVRDHVMRSELLEYVARPLLRFRPIAPAALPAVWTEGSYRASLWFLGVLPVGWQAIKIEPQPMRGDVWSIRDNGHGALIRTWDHMIEIKPEGEGTRYVDRVTIDAGWLTPAVGSFARAFYAHRQRRWRRLVANGFDYGG